VALPATPATAVVARSAVQARDIDPMGHVNNTVYMDYLEEAVLAAGSPGAAALAAIPRDIRLEYVVAAGPGESLVSATWQADDGVGGIAWRLADDEGRELARGRVTG
jgi:acyl-ACP thioesterase